MMPAYLNLSTCAWLQLRRSWRLPKAAIPDLRVYLSGGLQSVAGLIQTAVMGRRRRAASVDGAVFILGFWRSGTTLLHELLCSDDRYGYATTYACLNPHHFLLTQDKVLKKQKDLVQRAQDKMVIGWQSPQEDEFGLLCLGARSPYEGMLSPQNFASALRLSDMDNLSGRERRRWRKTFMRFLRGVSLANGQKPLVLKSPTHSYRVPELKKLLPDARFIIIVRNPYDVFESMVRTYRTLADKYGLTETLSDDEVREALLIERVHFEKQLNAGIDQLPQDKCMVVRFEDLVREPMQAMQSIYERLQLPDFEVARHKLQTEIDRRKDYSQSASQPEQAWKEKIRSSWFDVFDRYGYE